MSTFDPAYRVTVYAPRSVDPAEITVLTPRAGAAHSNPFRVADRTGISGFQPYLARPPYGRQGSLDPLEKRTDTGTLTLELADVRTTPGGSNLSRWVTAFAGDPENQNQLLGLKVKVEESTDGGSSWADYYTGRIQDSGLNGRLVISLTVRDMAEDLNVDIFTGAPASGLSYVVRTPLVPTGLVEAFGDFPVMSKLSFKSEHVVAGSRAYMRVIGGQTVNASWRRIVTASWPGASDDQHALYLPPKDSIRIWLKITSGGGVRNGEEGEFRRHQARSAWPDFLPTINKGGDGHWYVDAMLIAELPPTDPAYMALPPQDAVCDIYVYDRGKPSEGLPILINDVHPVQIWKDMLDGKFGRLKDDGTPYYTFAYDSSAFDALIAKAYPPARYIITGSDRLNDWVEANILQQFNLGYRFDASGRVVPLDLRLPSSLTGISTITDAELYLEEAPGWEQGRDSAITVMEGTYYLDSQLPDEALKESVSSLPDIRPCRIESKTGVLRLEDFGRTDMGEKAFALDATAYRAMPTETIEGGSREDWILATLERELRELRGPFGSGAAYVTLVARRVGSVNDCYPGDLRILDVDVLPDPATNLRGGARLAWCVERWDDGPRIRLRFLDAGEAIVSVAPTAGSPSQNTDSPKHAVDVVVTLNASTEPARVDYAITEQSAAIRPGDDSSLWTWGALVAATGTLTLTGLPSGKRVWIRLRTEPGPGAGRKLPSAWAYSSPTGYANTASITAPSGLGSSSVTSSTALLAWTNGDADYPVEILLVLGGAPGSWTTDDRVAALAAGATQYQLRGLDGPSTQHTAAVRHRDPSGGTSAVVTHTFSTGTTAPSAPRPAGLMAAEVGVGPVEV